MERKKATDFPQELLNMFDQYVHGDINRRQFLEGANKFALGGLTATALFESLRPHFAWAQQVAKDDSRIKAESTTVPSPQGNGNIRGYLVTRTLINFGFALGLGCVYYVLGLSQPCRLRFFRVGSRLFSELCWDLASTSAAKTTATQSITLGRTSLSNSTPK